MYRSIQSKANHSAFSPIASNQSRSMFASRPFEEEADVEAHSQTDPAQSSIQAHPDSSSRPSVNFLTVPLHALSSAYPGAVQAKLTIGQPGDQYEQEADRTASQVMRMPDPQPASEPIAPLIAQPKLSVQAKGNGTETNQEIESQLSQSQGSGSRLPEQVRSFMEPQFGSSFENVRVHTDGNAVQMNQALGAQAFTHGSDIYYGAGKSPTNSDLTAHELTHVVQQTGGVQPKQSVQRKCAECAEEDTVRRSIDISSTAQPSIQRWFGEEEETESENDSGGGVVDWLKEKIGGAVDSAVETGGAVVDWGKEKGGAALETAKQIGGEVVDSDEEKGKQVVDQLTGNEPDSDEAYNTEAEQHRSSLLAQTNELRQRIAEHDVVYLIEGELASVNQYCTVIRERLPNIANLPDISVSERSLLSMTNPDVLPRMLPIAIPTIGALLEAIAKAIAALTFGEFLLVVAILAALIALLIALFSDETGRYTNPSPAPAPPFSPPVPAPPIGNPKPKPRGSVKPRLPRPRLPDTGKNRERCEVPLPILWPRELPLPPEIPPLQRSYCVHTSGVCASFQPRKMDSNWHAPLTNVGIPGGD